MKESRECCQRGTGAGFASLHLLLDKTSQDFLVVQWLKFCTYNTGCMGYVLVQGSKILSRVAKQTKTKKTLQNNLTLNKQMQCVSCRPDLSSGKPKINLEILLLKETEARRGNRAGFTYWPRAEVQVSPPFPCIGFHPWKEGVRFR